MKVKTVWEYSLKTEAERLLHCAHQMAVGFYRLNNFIVLPYTPKIEGVNLVTFPDLPYNKIPRFWEKVKQIDIKTLPIKVASKLLVQMENFIVSANLVKPDFERIKNVWSKAETEVLSTIYQIMPAYKNKVKQITILPTAI